MSKSLCLYEFIHEFFEFLPKVGYAQSTIICYQKCADKFQAFAKQKTDAPTFSRELVDSYIEYYDLQYPVSTQNDIKRRRKCTVSLLCYKTIPFTVQFYAIN